MKASNLSEIGIGVDLEMIKKFKDKKMNNVILKRIFTHDELTYCFKQKNPAQHLTARFAAKEAVVKALTQLGIAQLSVLTYRDIEVVHSANGSPAVLVSAVKRLPISIHISMSHSGDHAIALAFINKRNNYIHGKKRYNS
jgi:phosphopantetheine--protein transferase-like protein